MYVAVSRLVFYSVLFLTILLTAVFLPCMSDTLEFFLSFLPVGRQNCHREAGCEATTVVEGKVARVFLICQIVNLGRGGCYYCAVLPHYSMYCAPTKHETSSSRCIGNNANIFQVWDLIAALGMGRQGVGASEYVQQEENCRYDIVGWRGWALISL